VGRSTATLSLSRRLIKIGLNDGRPDSELEAATHRRPNCQYNTQLEIFNVRGNCHSSYAERITRRISHVIFFDVGGLAAQAATPFISVVLRCLIIAPVLFLMLFYIEHV